MTCLQPKEENYRNLVTWMKTFFIVNQEYVCLVSTGACLQYPQYHVLGSVKCIEMPKQHSSELTPTDIMLKGHLHVCQYISGITNRKDIFGPVSHLLFAKTKPQEQPQTYTVTRA